jgi:hypothetical protein
MPDPVPLRDVLPDVIDQIETAYLEHQAVTDQPGGFSHARKDPP